MKLDIRMEDGRPVIFWVDNPDTQPGRVQCFTRAEGHGEACRAYMRSLPRPEKAADVLAAFRLLKMWGCQPPA